MYTLDVYRPPRAGEKRKAPVQYSGNPNSVKTRKCISQKTEAQTAVRSRPGAVNVLLPREVKMSRRPDGRDGASAANQQKQEQELRRRNEEHQYGHFHISTSLY